MKKIGILTTYFATNFGAMLQPFALKRTLENFDFDVEFIRYKQPKVYNVYKPIHLKRFLSTHIQKNIRYLKECFIYLKKSKNFKKFKLRYLQPKDGFAKDIDPSKDFYIMGSDQIWNPVVTGGFDDIYFGRFQTKNGAKKIAYAASAESIEYTPKQADYLKRNLQNFDFISVREHKLAEDLSNVTGRNDIQTVLDPTLLANPSIYNEIEIKNPLPDQKFVFFYKIRNCWNFIDKIHSYAKQKKAKLLILSSWYESAIEEYARQNSDVTYIPTAGVEIFLGAIRHSECVFTPSFHGCAFPIIFHKPFFSLLLEDNWNTRVNDLLNNLGLSERLLTEQTNIVDSSIDFSNVDNRLQERRDQSISFLKNSLST